MALREGHLVLRVPSVGLRQGHLTREAPRHAPHSGFMEPESSCGWSPSGVFCFPICGCR